MTAESNKKLSRRFFDEVFEKGNLQAADEIFAAGHTAHGPGALPGAPNGPEGMRQVAQFYRTAFPDIHFTIDEQVAEGDRVITRYTAKGTQKGEMTGVGIPVTGRPATVTGVVIDRIENGKIVESWGIFDQYGMMQQLGAVPTPEQGSGQMKGRKTT